MKHFDQWVNGQLPRQIAEQFFEPLSQAFQRYGMSSGRFRQVWDQLDALDPRKAIELWGVLAQAVVDFFETMAYFRTDVFQYQGPGDFAPSAGPAGLLEQGRIRNHESFADALAREDEEILNLAESLDLLTGEEQIRAAGRLGEMMRDRQRAEEEFFQRMAQIIEDVNASLDQFLLDIDLEQMVTPEGEPDWQARINRLQSEGERVWNSLTTATTPEEIAYWTNEWMRVNREILSAAQNLGPEAYQQYLAWVEENTNRFRTDVAERFRQLGQDIQDANDRFIAAIKMFIAAFTQGAKDVGDVLGGGDGDGDGGGGGGGDDDEDSPTPIIIPDGQFAVFEESNATLSSIEGYSAETVSLLAELVANGGTTGPQNVRVHGSVRLEGPDGIERDIILRRIDTD
jgi:hypothetical protein